jgi:hypothetical protein
MVMALGIKIYKMKNFIRKAESGEVDFDRSIEIVREVAAAAAFHTDHNILMDMRRTTVSLGSMEEMIKIAVEFVNCMPSFKNKMANVIPDETRRVATAKEFEACMKLKNFQYRFFTDFEEAIEWLSDVVDTH